ncbi:MAG: DUF4349 domain-containing protein [Flavobacteriales bacterium]
MSATSEGDAVEEAPLFKTAQPEGLAANNWTSVADSSMPAKPKPMSSSAAVHNGDTIRRFIRTADLRFRVKDVVSATYAIEDLIAGFGGFVEHTRLSSNVDHRYTTPVSADSVLETTRYTVVNRATLRVPVAQLDTALKSLARFVDFMDHRTVQAEDVRLMILANRLAQRRIAEHARRTQQAVDEHGKKLRDVADAQDALLRRQEQADEATLSTLRLEDRISYSTIAIEIYQRQAVRHEMLANERNIARYEPGFFSKLAGAVAEGWRMLLRFILFLAGNWSIILLALGAFWLLRRFFRSKGQG